MSELLSSGAFPDLVRPCLVLCQVARDCLCALALLPTSGPASSPPARLLLQPPPLLSSSLPSLLALFLSARLGCITRLLTAARITLIKKREQGAEPSGGGMRMRRRRRRRRMRRKQKIARIQRSHYHTEEQRK